MRLNCKYFGVTEIGKERERERGSDLMDITQKARIARPGPGQS